MAHRDRDLDRFLSGDEGIAPSSGFVANVMDAVARDALQPQAIPFPWTRALPGMAATALAAASIVAGGYRIWRDVPAPAQPDEPLEALLGFLMRLATSTEVVWIVFAAVITIAPLMLAWRFTRGRRNGLNARV